MTDPWRAAAEHARKQQRRAIPPAEGPATPVTEAGKRLLTNMMGMRRRIPGDIGNPDTIAHEFTRDILAIEREAAARIDPDSLGTAIHTVNYGWFPHNGEAGHDPGDSDCACNAAQIADAYNARLAAVQEPPVDPEDEWDEAEPR